MKKILYFSILLSFLLTTASFADSRNSTLQCAEIIFDQSNEQVYSPFDTGFSGMSELAAFLTEAGAHVSLNSELLEKRLPSLRGKSVILVLGVAMFREYSDEAVRAVMEFVRNGGGLLVLTEHNNLMKNCGLQNKILMRFGITALDGSVRTLRKNTLSPSWPYCRVKEWAMEQVQFFLPAPFQLTSPALPLVEVIEPDEKGFGVIGALSRFEKGCVIALGDAEMVWNGDDFLGIRAGNNKEFLLRVFKTLAGKTPTPAEKTKHSVQGKRRIFFETTGLMPDESLNGLGLFAEALEKAGFEVSALKSSNTGYEDIDLVVLANPLKDIPDAEKMLHARHILLIQDGQSDFLSFMIDVRSAFEALSKKKLVQKDMPINAVANKFGIKFLPVTVVSNQPDHLEAKARWTTGEDILLRRASAIAPLEKEFPAGITILARTGSAWSSECITPLQYSAGPLSFPFQPPDEKDMPPLAVIASGERFFAVSDLEPLTNAYFSTPESQVLFRKILEWMGK